jgi:uncharacterized Zn finger protein
MTECKWKSFEEFRNCAFGYWKITLPSDANDTNWKQSTCTCPVYFKQYMCKHIIAICLSRKLTKAPHEAKQIKFGEQRKAGRPKQIVKALARQPQFTSLLLEQHFSDEDDDDVLNPNGRHHVQEHDSNDTNDTNASEVHDSMLTSDTNDTNASEVHDLLQMLAENQSNQDDTLVGADLESLDNIQPTIVINHQYFDENSSSIGYNSDNI